MSNMFIILNRANAILDLNDMGSLKFKFEMEFFNEHTNIIAREALEDYLIE